MTIDEFYPEPPDINDPEYNRIWLELLIKSIEAEKENKMRSFAAELARFFSNMAIPTITDPLAEFFATTPPAPKDEPTVTQPLSIEVEVKALVPAADVQKLRSKLLDGGYKSAQALPESQLNWYYQRNAGDVATLMSSVFRDAKVPTIPSAFFDTKNISVRTRSVNGGSALLVLKASLDSGTSENGSNRLEWQYDTGLSMEALDTRIWNSGFVIASKWSRERTTYVYGAVGEVITACLDKNAGYGYVLELEMMLDSGANKKQIAEQHYVLTEELASLGLTELPADRLERMFKFYQANWWDYYGTDKVFEVL